MFSCVARCVRLCYAVPFDDLCRSIHALDRTGRRFRCRSHILVAVMRPKGTGRHHLTARHQQTRASFVIHFPETIGQFSGFRAHTPHSKPQRARHSSVNDPFYIFHAVSIPRCRPPPNQPPPNTQSAPGLMFSLYAPVRHIHIKCALGHTHTRASFPSGNQNHPALYRSHSRSSFPHRFQPLLPGGMNGKYYVAHSAHTRAQL